jgi:hypothetical protein
MIGSNEARTSAGTFAMPGSSIVSPPLAFNSLIKALRAAE